MSDIPLNETDDLFNPVFEVMKQQFNPKDSEEDEEEEVTDFCHIQDLNDREEYKEQQEVRREHTKKLLNLEVDGDEVSHKAALVLKQKIVEERLRKEVDNMSKSDLEK